MLDMCGIYSKWLQRFWAGYRREIKLLVHADRAIKEEHRLSEVPPVCYISKSDTLAVRIVAVNTREICVWVRHQCPQTNAQNSSSGAAMLAARSKTCQC